MSVPQCQALDCGGVADDGKGLCAAHRRALTLTVKVQDAVREFLRGSANGPNAISLSEENIDNAGEAGMYFAEGLALLTKTVFRSNVAYDEQPIEVAYNSQGCMPEWQVKFTWSAAMNTNAWSEQNRCDELSGAEDGDAS